MLTTVLSIWTNSDSINSLILLVYSVMAWLMYKTFRIGQRQTKYSLAINQFNIFNDQFKDLRGEGINLKFESDIYPENEINNYTRALENSNGIHYIEFFPLSIHFGTIPNIQQIHEVRSKVLFPLTRYYDRLYKYIKAIYNDNILTQEYKNILLHNIERDILQTYFRVCNNKLGQKKTVDLNIFKTNAFIPENSFLKINQFYIEKRLFQFENLVFYETTF